MSADAKIRTQPVIKMIADAERAAGWRATAAAERNDYGNARAWLAVAATLRAALTDATRAMAGGTA